MKEEDFIREQAGKENPFRVPEGYFDQFTERVMQRLPECRQDELVSQPTVWQRIKPWLYMAAMFVAILLPIRVIMEHTGAATSAEARSEQNYAEEYIEYAILDRTEMDDYSFYLYLNAEEESLTENLDNDNDL